MTALCSHCPHQLRLKERRCQPEDACVRVDSGRLMDRFFHRNPDLAPVYYRDAFWERRAVTVRYLPVALALELAADDDPIVRYAVASRLPPALLSRFMHDTDREVRIVTARRLPADVLYAMADDTDYLVRAAVAQRLPEEHLFGMAYDVDRQVRKLVAQRLPLNLLPFLAADPEVDVRRVVAERADRALAATLLRDSDWLVRYAAVGHAPVKLLVELAAYDPEPDVRNAALARLQNTPEENNE